MRKCNGWCEINLKRCPRQAKVAQGVPGRLRPRIILTFGTTTVVGRQPYAPAAFTPGEIPDTHFQWLSRPQGTWFCWKEPRKKFPVTPSGIDPGTVRLNHYATPGPNSLIMIHFNIELSSRLTSPKSYHAFRFLD